MSQFEGGLQPSSSPSIVRINAQRALLESQGATGGTHFIAQRLPIPALGLNLERLPTPVWSWAFPPVRALRLLG